jgi:hypothetical protein
VITGFMCTHAMDVYRLLADFIREENPRENSIVIAFWSASIVWLMALLAHGASFEGDVDVARYIRRVVGYGP